MTTKTFATFRLGTQLFGVEVLYVREINKQLDMTTVPHSPDYVRGLVNLRGQIVTVIDLRQRLFSRYIQLTDKTCNLILKTDAELSPIRQREQRPDLYLGQDIVGLLVDEIEEIVTVEEDAIDKPPNNLGEIEYTYLNGVVQLENKLLALLSVDNILAP